jgi:hypothetical protein
VVFLVITEVVLPSPVINSAVRLERLPVAFLLVSLVEPLQGLQDYLQI